MRYCENCSRPLPEGSDVCPRCVGGGENRISGTSRVLLTLLSIFFSPAGIVAGVVYMTKDSKEHRVFGKRMLVVSLVALTFFLICCCVLYAFAFNYLAAEAI